MVKITVLALMLVATPALADHSPDRVHFKGFSKLDGAHFQGHGPVNPHVFVQEKPVQEKPAVKVSIIVPEKVKPETAIERCQRINNSFQPIWISSADIAFCPSVSV